MIYKYQLNIDIIRFYNVLVFTFFLLKTVDFKMYEKMEKFTLSYKSEKFTLSLTTIIIIFFFITDQ